jgi:hypothetical protein
MIFSFHPLHLHRFRHLLVFNSAYRPTTAYPSPHHQELDFGHPIYLKDAISAVVDVRHVRGDNRVVTLSTNWYHPEKVVAIKGEAVVLVDRSAATPNV